MKIKVLPRIDNERRTRNDHVAIFNKRKERMITGPLVYQIAKENDPEEIQKIQQDCEDSVLVLNLSLDYDKNTLKTTIIHDADSTVVKPTKCKDVIIPDLLGDFEKDKIIERLLRKVFRTKDSIETILNELKNIGGDRPFRIVTPSQSSREDGELGFAYLFFYFGRFGLFLGFRYDNGVTRGVLSNSAKQSNFSGKIVSKKAVFDFDQKTITLPMPRSLIKDMKRKSKKNRKVRIRLEAKN